MFILRNKKIFIGISTVFVVVSLALIFIFGLNFGIDFKGGSLVEATYPNGRPSIELIQSSLSSGFENANIQNAGDNGIILKSRDLTEAERIRLFEDLTIDGQYLVNEDSFTSIGPSLGKEMTRKATSALVIVALCIILFIAYAFRKVSKPVSSWKYGIVAVITLIHDVLLTTGVFALLGRFAGVELDALFVVALLTVLGLSVNDTIVVFDRIRENLLMKKDESFESIVGNSISQTIIRSVGTSFSTIIVLVALVIWGPASTKYFALALAFGMFFGTYSSIFVASPLLVMLEKKES